MAARTRINDLIDAQIADARSAPRPDDHMLTMLINGRGDEGYALSDNEIRDSIISLITAGYETTSGALAWAIYTLLTLPGRLGHCRRRSPSRAAVIDRPAADDLDALTYLNGVVHETLRLYPPGVISARRVMRDLWFDGHRIRAGRLLIFSPYVTHRLPELWPEPTEFRPPRWDPGSPDYRKPAPHEFIPFSGGLHRCIGAVMATTEMTVMLARLVARTRLRLPAQRIRASNLAALSPAAGTDRRESSTQCQRSSTSSEQNPGPIASISPGLPLGGGLAMVSRRMCSTEADERLAISPSERQVSSSASGAQLEALGDRVDDLRTAGMAHPCADVVLGQPVRGRGTGRRRRPGAARSRVGSSGDSTSCRPPGPTFQPMMCSDSG